MQKVYYASVATLHPGEIVRPYGTNPIFVEHVTFVSSLIARRLPISAIKTKFQHLLTSWGLSVNDLDDKLAVVSREALAEAVRKTHFPDRPSRLGSTFVTLDYEFAWLFLYLYRELNGWVYECSTDCADLFTGDMEIVTHARLTSEDIENGAPEFIVAACSSWTLVERLALHFAKLIA